MSTIMQKQSAVALEALQLQQFKTRVSVEVSDLGRPSRVVKTATRAAAATPAMKPATAPAPSPRTQRALVVTSKNTYELRADFPAPVVLASGEVLIRNWATGLNHIDWMSVEYNVCLPELPWITGREMAGEVEAVGPGVDLNKGDRVWTTTYYKDRRAGCFQELVVVPQHTVFAIPATLDFHHAACLGVAGMTAAMTLWRWLEVPMTLAGATPQATPDVLLVWGGSTVTGQFVIQLAAQAGLEVVAVCSAATAELVRNRGASHVVTYTGRTDAKVIAEILHCCGGRLTRAVDLVGAHTAALVLQVIAAVGRPVEFAPLAYMDRTAMVPGNARVHTVEMKQFVLDRASAVYGQRLNELVASGVVQLPAVRVLPGGLGAVESGLALLREGNLNGKKLVVSFD